MFQFAGFASYAYVFSVRYPQRGGFPHSEIHGSTFARNFPRLIATCYVLHRLSVPRHPPNALLTLDHNPSCAGINPTHKGSEKIWYPTTYPAVANAQAEYAYVLGKSSSQCQRANGSQGTRKPVTTTDHLINKVVEVNGIEPMTSCLQSRRSPN